MKPINLMHAMDGVGDDILLEAETFHAAKQKPDLRSFRLMRVTAAILVLAMLAGCVAGSLEISLWNGGRNRSWGEVADIAVTHNLQLPDSLLDAPFLDCDYLNLTEQPTSWFIAMFFPDYRYYSVNYGTEVVHREYHRDEFGFGCTQWNERDEVISLTFGSTASEHWRRQFGFNENDVWTGTASRSADLIAAETTELNGQTLYLATYCSIQEPPLQKLNWYDSERGLVIQLEAYAENWDCLLAAADELMVRNP